MKPKLKQEADLEELAIAYAEAEEEALAEQVREPTYRENADLSTLLDIPRSVDGLVKLLEEKKEIEKELKEIEERKYYINGTLLNSAFGVTFAAILVEAYYNQSLLTAMTTFLAGASVTFGINFYLRSKPFPKANLLQAKQNELKPLEKKLSHYEKDYRLTDIVLVDDPELGYSLGDIRYNNREETTLHQSYHKLIHGVEDALDNRAWKQMEEYKPIDKTKIVSILQPSHESLSVDDLRNLEEGTPIFYHSTELLTDRPAYHFSDYGFIDNKKDDDFFNVRTLRPFQGPGEHCLKYESVEKGEENAFLLEPVIK